VSTPDAKRPAKSAGRRSGIHDPPGAAPAAVPVSVRHRVNRKGDTRLAARFAWPSKLAQGTGGDSPPCERAPPAKAAPAAAPVSVRHRGSRRGDTRLRHVSRARLARTANRGPLALCERALPAKAAPAAVSVSIKHRGRCKRGHAPSARFAWPSKLAQRIRWRLAPVRAGPAREGRASGRLRLHQAPR
jgi:hypothetical protein